MKRCFKCGSTKPLSEFYKHKQTSDGHLNKCKECTKLDSRANEKNLSNKDGSYDRTEKGVVRVIYKTQILNSKIRGHEPPNYTKEDLKDWLYQNNFKNLYDNWVKSEYSKNSKPSVDRVDTFKGYSLNNIQLVTWGENFKNQNIDILNGLGTSGKRCKKVLQFDSRGVFMAEHISFSSARRTVGYSMERALKSGKKDRKNGFIWKYAE